jgi:hypothetical protein
LNAVQFAWLKLTSAVDQSERDRDFVRVLDLAVNVKLPKRRKLRSDPRLIGGAETSSCFTKPSPTIGSAKTK